MLRDPPLTARDTANLCRHLCLELPASAPTGSSRVTYTTGAACLPSGAQSRLRVPQRGCSLSLASRQHLHPGGKSPLMAGASEGQAPVARSDVAH